MKKQLTDEEKQKLKEGYLASAKDDLLMVNHDHFSFDGFICPKCGWSSNDSKFRASADSKDNMVKDGLVGE